MEALKQLKESSLSRVWQMASDDSRNFAIVTACKFGLTEEENHKRNAELCNFIRSSGYGYFVLHGVYSYEDPTKGSQQSQEESFFVSCPQNDDGKLIGFARKVISEYQQECVLLKIDGEMFLLYEGHRKVMLGKFSPNKVADSFSKLRNGSTFVFESASRTPSFVDAFLEQTGRRKFCPHEIP